MILRGSDLEGASALWFDHGGLSAVHMKDLTFRISAGPDVPLGHHDVRATGTYGVSNPRTIVVGVRPESIEVEPNNAPEKAGAIVVNSVMNGEINGAADIDCFALEGRKGQRLFLDLEAERIDSRLDATIRIWTPTGTELAESRDVNGLDPFVDVTLPVDGRYVIKVHDATYAGSPDHVYRLTVHDGPQLDAVLPAAVGPGPAPEFTLIGRGLGAGATADRRLMTEGVAFERLSLPNPIREAALLATDPSGAALEFCRAFDGRAAAWCGLRVRANQYDRGDAFGLELALRRPVGLAGGGRAGTERRRGARPEGRTAVRHHGHFCSTR